MSRDLGLAHAGLRMAERRAMLGGNPGITVWTDTAGRAIARAAANVEAVQSELVAVRADLFAAKQSGRSLRGAIERANRRLAAAVERLGLCLLFVAGVVAGVALSSDDDHARRASRGRVRRRDEVEMIADAETGDEV